MTTVPNTAARSLLDPDSWRLQLPVDRSGGFSGRSLEVVGLDSYSSPYFSTGPDGALVLAAPVEGATTSGSRYARSELRQLIEGENAAWSLSEGGRLDVTLQIDHVPSLTKGGAARVVIGQVLSDDFDQLVRLYYQNGTLSWVNGRNEAVSRDATYAITDSAGHVPSISLDETFSFGISVKDRSLAVTVQADGVTYTSGIAIGPGWADNGFFFKTGIYLGSDETTSRGWGQVSLFDVDVATGIPTGPGLPPPVPPPTSAVISDNGFVAALSGTGGDDIFLVSREATTVRGGGGFDTVRASVSWTMSRDVEALVLLGSADIHGTGGRADDSILGNGGANTLAGNDGDDSLRGGDGADTLLGGDDDDRLDGGAGRDLLLGGDDDDILAGGADSDTLNGGGGRDTLTGGDGADVFVLSAARDSRMGHADILTDFATGLDRIDLRAIDANSRETGDQAFVWNGSGAGRLVLQSGMLLADVNGDGRWDLALDLRGAPVTAADILL